MQLWNIILFFVLVSLSVVARIFGTSCSLMGKGVVIWWYLESLRNQDLVFSIVLDPVSLYFLGTVFLISGCVFLFSMSYMAAEIYYFRFHVLVGLFVISIVLLIISPNIIRVLLGWDGLGITSYLLVVYYQRSKARNAGIITVLSNRVGDVLILLAIGGLAYRGSWELSLRRLGQDFFSAPLLLLVLARFTKRAQVPFSAWLPAAMAAPTPVSSLVHSSTLVTAGVYLVIRFQPVLKCSDGLNLILVVGSITILMAGITAIVEIDIKKVIALSTLSQLGVIITTLGCGLTSLAYFHLLSHAFFKAIIFIRIGAIIHLVGDFQDLHKSTVNVEFTPARIAFNIVGNASLCGLPFLRGFYSKDLCIEGTGAIQAFPAASAIFYLATLFTVGYTVRLLALCFSRNWITSPSLPPSESDLATLVSIAGLVTMALWGGAALRWRLLAVPAEFMLSGLEKAVTLFVIFLGGVLGVSIVKSSPLKLLKIRKVIMQSWGLFLVSARIPSATTLSLRRGVRTFGDSGWVWERTLIVRGINTSLRSAGISSLKTTSTLMLVAVSMLVVTLGLL